MASTDWADLDSSQDSATFVRGVTAGVTAPDGGGSFVYGWNSQAAVSGGGAHGLYVDKGPTSGFTPLKNDADAATGGSVRAALKRGVSAGTTGFAPMLFINLKSGALDLSVPSVSDVGYLLGLENSNPARIVLRKGSPVGGLTSSLSTPFLRTSSIGFNPDTWVHLRLDAIFNANGDVVLKVFYNDIDANDVTSPVWTAVPGMADYIDDVLQVNTGSAPLAGGFIGFAYQSTDLNRRAYIDQVEVVRQR